MNVPSKMLTALAVVVAIAGCSSSSSPSPVAPVTPPAAETDAGPTAEAAAPALTDAQHIELITAAMHDELLKDLDSLVLAVTDVQSAAPSPLGRGWSATQDAAAISAMKSAWVRARAAYEHVEGAFAPIFPDLDAALDARYDDYLTELLASGGDPNLFDDRGVTGLHGIERIVYFADTPKRVVDFEKSLPGYIAARYPSTEAEALEFKNKLCGRTVADASELKKQWGPAKINIAVAFQGLIALMNEQREKVTKASTNEEESRYAQRTMADIRGNLDGTTTIYAIFRPWLLTKRNATDPTKDGPAIDAKIQAGFAKLATTYGAVPGDAIPEPPATWSAETPSPADLASPFGQLYTHVREAVDPAKESGVVYQMNEAATLLGFPQFAH